MGEEEEEEEGVIDLTGSGDEEEEAAGVAQSRTDDDDVPLCQKLLSSPTGSRNNADCLLSGSYNIVLCVDFIETTG